MADKPLLMPAHSPKRWVKIMNYLHENTEFQNTRQIAKATNLAITMVVRDMKELTDLGHVNRYPARGRGFIYTFLSFKPTNTKIAELEQSLEYIDVSLGDITKLLFQWSTKPWRPKIYETSRNLPLGLARLYELANQVGLGANPDKTDTDSIKSDFNDFRRDLLTTLRIVNGILIAEDLWDIKELASYLLTQTDTQIVTNLVEGIRKYN